MNNLGKPSWTARVTVAITLDVEGEDEHAAKLSQCGLPFISTGTGSETFEACQEICVQVWLPNPVSGNFFAKWDSPQIAKQRE
jgi:hypothetical protein